MSGSEGGQLAPLLREVRDIYDRLFEAGEVESARLRFRGLLDRLAQLLPSLQGEARLDALHLQADLAVELGDGALVRQAACELAGSFQPTQPEELEGLVEDMVAEWWCPSAAQQLLGRVLPGVDPQTVRQLQEVVQQALQQTNALQLTAAEILALRAWLLEQGVVTQEADGTVALTDDPEDPFRHTRSWLEEHGHDAAVELAHLEESGLAERDAEVLLSVRPQEPYDVLAHWSVEALVRQYWAQPPDGEPPPDEWSARSPDGEKVALFDDEGDAAYLYVFDPHDDELVAPPLWLFNRIVAPQTEGGGTVGEAPCMPACYVRDPLPHPRAEVVEIFWTADSSRVAVQVDGELLGFVDLDQSALYSAGLIAETDFGNPWPEGLAWDAVEPTAAE